MTPIQVKTDPVSISHKAVIFDYKNEENYPAEMLVKEILVTISGIDHEHFFSIEKYGLNGEHDVSINKIVPFDKILRRENGYRVLSIDFTILYVGNPENWGDDDAIDYVHPTPFVYMYTHKVKTIDDAKTFLGKIDWLTK